MAVKNCVECNTPRAACMHGWNTKYRNENDILTKAIAPGEGEEKESSEEKIESDDENVITINSNISIMVTLDYLQKEYFAFLI